MTTKKMYEYTVYHQNGDVEGWKQPKMSFDDMRQLVSGGHCMLELIPKDYWPKEIGRAGNVWGDEEGRFNSDNHRNPHFRVIVDNEGHEWDCVGKLVHEKVAK